MPATKLLAVVDAEVALTNVGPDGDTVHAPVIPEGSVLPTNVAVVAEHKFCVVPALTAVGFALIVKAAVAIVLQVADDDSVTWIFPVIGAAPIAVTIEAVPAPDDIVTPVGVVHTNELLVEAVLNVVLGVPSHKVVVPVMLGVGLIGLFTTTVDGTAAHGAFVTVHVNV